MYAQDLLESGLVAGEISSFLAKFENTYICVQDLLRAASCFQKSQYWWEVLHGRCHLKQR